MANIIDFEKAKGEKWILTPTEKDGKPDIFIDFGDGETGYLGPKHTAFLLERAAIEKTDIATTLINIICRAMDDGGPWLRVIDNKDKENPEK